MIYYPSLSGPLEFKTVCPDYLPHNIRSQMFIWVFACDGVSLTKWRERDPEGGQIGLSASRPCWPSIHFYHREFVAAWCHYKSSTSDFRSLDNVWTVDFGLNIFSEVVFKNQIVNI